MMPPHVLALIVADPDAAASVVRRALEEAIVQAAPEWWERRAQVLLGCMHSAGDFPGRRTPAELAAHNTRCAEAAQACRSHATLLRETHPLDAELRAVLDDAEGVAA